MMTFIGKLIRYVFLTSFAACGLARYDSGIAVQIKDSTRTALLIFSYTKERISALAIISQCCTYAIVMASVLFQVIVTRNILKAEILYTMVDAIDWIIRVQLLGLIPIALLEEWIYWLRKTRHG